MSEVLKHFKIALSPKKEAQKMAISHPPKVAMIVWNDFRNDARVLKEAQTLTRNGAQVCVFALHAADGSTPTNQEIEERLTVNRVSRKPHAWALAKYKILMSLFKGDSATQSTPQSLPKPSAKSSQTATVERSRIRTAVSATVRLFSHARLCVRMIKMRPSVVHAHDINTLPTAWVAARLSGARLVYDAHEVSTDREGYSSLRNVIAFFEKSLMPRADACITTTRMRAQFFQRAWKIKDITVLQNRPRFSKPQQSNRLREELNIPEDAVIAIYQGGLQPGRGLHNFVSAAQQCERAHFVLVGGGRQTESLHSHIEQLGLNERVHIIPLVPLSELPSYTASADIGVQPIRNTCFNHYSTDSNKLFEYVMAGLPVVATDFPEIRKVVVANGLGLLAEAGNLSDLEQKIAKLVETPALRKEYGDNSRANAYALSWEAQEHELVNLYTHVLSLKGISFPIQQAYTSS